MKKLDWAGLGEKERAGALRRPAISRSPGLRRQVAMTIAAVRRRGDAAVKEFTRRYDKAALKSLKVGPGELNAAYKRVAPADLAALKEAVRRVSLFHQKQLPKPYSIEIAKGVLCRRRFVPLEKVGLYVPGGSAPLPSTVIMLGVPARIAGCPVKVLATPPRPDGSIDPHILAAARLVGVTDIYKAGGAQAIAALAYGTRTIPKTDKIFGPGNPWVAEAKIQASQDPDGAACDFPAGPSEVLVIADAAADPVFVAGDLLAQAEHGPDSQVVLLAASSALLQAVSAQLNRQLRSLPRAAIARAALAKSLMIRVRDVAQAFEVSNRYAPEHLILHLANPRRWVDRITNAASVFLGPWSPESVGDYAGGPNHCLPTYGFARSHGGLTVESFMKSMTFQELTAEGLAKIGPVVERLALVEGLQAHKEAVSLRLKRLQEAA